MKPREREVLTAARALIAKGYRPDVVADASGRPIAPRDARAAYWCVVGAIDCVTPLDHELRSSLCLLKFRTPPATQAEALSLFDAALGSPDVQHLYSDV